MVSRLSDQLGTGRQTCLCAFTVDIGGRQVLPLPPAPSAPHLPALQPAASIARPVLMGRFLHPMQALARFGFGQRRSGAIFGSPPGIARLGNLGGQPGWGSNRSRVSQPAVTDQGAIIPTDSDRN